MDAVERSDAIEQATGMPVSGRDSEDVVQAFSQSLKEHSEIHERENPHRYTIPRGVSMGIFASQALVVSGEPHAARDVSIIF